MVHGKEGGQWYTSVKEVSGIRQRRRSVVHGSDGGQWYTAVKEVSGTQR